MVPIHYFLALIAILVSLMGCTQKAPLGSNQNMASKNTTGLVETRNTTEPKQTINHGGNPTVKPSIGGEPVQFSLDSPSAGEWRLNFAGEDSEMLYKLMETIPSKIKKEHSLMLIKNGSQMSCLRAKASYVCTLAFDSSKGEIKKTAQIEELTSFDADLILKEKYSSPFFELDTPTSEGKFGSLVILGSNAKSIYEALSVEVVSLKDIGTTHDRLGKQGKNVACYQETFGTDPDPSFACRFFFNYDTGTFDEIQVLN